MSAGMRQSKWDVAGHSDGSEGAPLFIPSESAPCGSDFQPGTGGAWAMLANPKPNDSSRRGVTLRNLPMACGCRGVGLRVEHLETLDSVARTRAAILRVGCGRLAGTGQRRGAVDPSAEGGGTSHIGLGLLAITTVQSRRAATGRSSGIRGPMGSGGPTEAEPSSPPRWWGSDVTEIGRGMWSVRTSTSTVPFLVAQAQLDPHRCPWEFAGGRRPRWTTPIR